MKIRLHLLNSLYFFVVFLVSLGFTTLSLARRVNYFESTKQPLLINIDKEDISVTNTVSGQISEILVEEGEHVSEGEVLLVLNDQNTQARIESLEEFEEDNLSARTEVNLLRAQTEQLEIRAPRDGVVYKISVGEGANINLNTELMVLFADSKLRLTGLVSPDQYAEIQNNRVLTAYSSRLEQVYEVEFEGVGRVYPATQHESSKYELVLRFINENEGSAFIEGESLEVISLRQDEEIERPSYQVARFWNQFIMGK